MIFPTNHLAGTNKKSNNNQIITQIT